MARYGFCHGWYLDRGFAEVTCKRRETCAYYDVDFYRHHVHHLDDFEEMFPIDPCPWYLEREGAVKQKPAVHDFLLLAEGDE